MKKIFYASLFAATSFTMSSCMNGDYDANPATNNSNIAVPVNLGGGGGGGGASKGQIIGTVNGTRRVFNYAYYFAAGGSSIAMQGADISNNINHSITLSISNYTGPNTYSIGNGTTGIYAELDASMNLKQWSTSGSNPGSGTITVTEDANNEIKGTFTLTAFAGSASDKVTITDGSFDVAKQ